MEQPKKNQLIISFVLIAAICLIALSGNAAFAAQSEGEVQADITADVPTGAQADENNGLADTTGSNDNGSQECPDCVSEGGKVHSTQTAQGVTAGLTAPILNLNIRGGYVANGTGMRNRGWGTILINGIPAGSTTNRAYLYWSIIGPSGVTIPPASYATGKVNGLAVYGTLIGSSTQPCWNGGKIFVYRADVTSKVPAGVAGNKPYHLTDFASGNVWGDIPGIGGLPLMEGASLVVVFNHLKYPMTNIQIKNGAETLIGTSSTTTFSGFFASSLPIAKTTYIVADGQTYTESVKFNGLEMPANFLDGIDRQNGNDFPGGNLQDTNTYNVKVTPGSTSASAQIISYTDCLTWEAQVFSISDGNLDTDGDGLKDSWELFGYDYNNDGIIDVNLPALGANWLHKDIFVEADYMAASLTEKQSHRPDPSVVTRSVSTFLNAPSANNPDGLPGINIHVEIGNQVPHDDDLNPVWAEFDAIKAANFPAARRDTHHYALFAHKYSGGTSSGLSRGIPASDFIVSLGGWPSNPGTPDEQTGTFIHELGHNLGLRHGGNDDVNYKPNYLSVMNYWFQVSGVYRKGAWGNFDYQRTTPYTLNEAYLYEANGIGAVSAGYGTKWTSPGCVARTTLTNMPIDWNANGVIASPVAVDTNCDGVKTTLNSQNNWLNIVYNGGTIGGISAGVNAQALTAEKMPKELDYDEFVKMNK